IRDDLVTGVQTCAFRSTHDLVARALAAGARAADAMAAEGDGLAVGVRLGEVEKLTRSRQRRAGLRVFVGDATAIVSTADFSPEGLAALARDAIALARATAPDPHAGLPDPAELAGEQPDLDLHDPAVELLEPEQALAWARDAEAAALDAPPPRRAPPAHLRVPGRLRARDRGEPAPPPGGSHRRLGGLPADVVPARPAGRAGRLAGPHRGRRPAPARRPGVAPIRRRGRPADPSHHRRARRARELAPRFVLGASPRAQDHGARDAQRGRRARRGAHELRPRAGPAPPRGDHRLGALGALRDRADRPRGSPGDRR